MVVVVVLLVWLSKGGGRGMGWVAGWGRVGPFVAWNRAAEVPPARSSGFVRLGICEIGVWDRDCYAVEVEVS